MDTNLSSPALQELQVEQALIGAILIDPLCTLAVLKDVQADCFCNKTNREIYETIVFMASNGMAIDPVAVMEQMRERDIFQENTADYLRQLIQMAPPAGSVLEYAAFLSDQSLRRKMKKAAGDFLDMLGKEDRNADEILELSMQNLFSLRREHGSGGLAPVSVAVKQVCESLQSRAEDGEVFPGIPTGLVDLDEYIQGLNAGELLLIASRPGMGKTSMALNIAMKAAKSTGKAVAFFSLDLSQEQVASRLLSSEAFVDRQRLIKGDLDAGAWHRIAEAEAMIDETNILVDAVSVPSVLDIYALCYGTADLGLVIVDYLQLLSPMGGKNGISENRNKTDTVNLHLLKNLAAELAVPVLCLTQISRACEARKNKRPVLSDLRLSDAVEQNADVVIGLYRESYYDKDCEDPGAAEAIILKNRKGETGTVNLRYLSEYMAFVSAARQNDY